MTLTEQHFNAFAKAVAAVRAGAVQSQEIEPAILHWMDEFFVPELANELARQNPRFDRELFVDACNEEA